MSQLKRAVDCAEVIARMNNAFNPDSLAPALTMKARPSDVFLAAYPKCGITWNQHIVHGLRSRGSLAFEEISEVIPWLEFAYHRNINLDDDQDFAFRGFKTHLTRELTPKEARYIYVLRDPRDCLVSYYHYYNGWFFDRDTVAIETFAREYFLSSQNPLGTYFDHVRSWWPQREQGNILFVCFEDIKEDLPRQVARIAEFLDIELDDELRDIVLRQSTFDFMKARDHQFDEHIIMPIIHNINKLPPGTDPVKVRAGRVGDHKNEIPPDTVATVDAMWRELLAEPLGADTYDELRRMLAG